MTTPTYYPTPSGKAPFNTAITQVPAGTPLSGWFVVPEGEVGQLTNFVTTALHASNPLDLFSWNGIKATISDTIKSIKQTFALAKGQQTTWTTIHATSPQQVQQYLNLGLTYYPTQADAQAQATTQTNQVKPPAGSGSGNGLLGTLAGFLGVGSVSGTNLVVRAVKVIIGGVLLIVGLVHITGADNAVATYARKVPLPV